MRCERHKLRPQVGASLTSVLSERPASCRHRSEIHFCLDASIWSDSGSSGHTWCRVQEGDIKHNWPAIPDDLCLFGPERPRDTNNAFDTGEKDTTPNKEQSWGPSRGQEGPLRAPQAVRLLMPVEKQTRLVETSPGRVKTELGAMGMPL
jgi:hypothetical protein